ncbi:hypothetical protein J6590_085941 [Homalodisca vitripennis]|nr:hypothetical protein J6590_085941 [Homalodisca vitripennis]
MLPQTQAPVSQNFLSMGFWQSPRVSIACNLLKTGVIKVNFESDRRVISKCQAALPHEAQINTQRFRLKTCNEIFLKGVNCVTNCLYTHGHRVNFMEPLPRSQSSHVCVRGESHFEQLYSIFVPCSLDNVDLRFVRNCPCSTGLETNHVANCHCLPKLIVLRTHANKPLSIVFYRLVTCGAK